MNSQMKLRDPTAESSPVRRARLTPPPSLDGKTVALMDIGKSRGAEFIDRLEGHFKKAGVATQALCQADQHQGGADRADAADRRREPARGDRLKRLRLLHIVQSARHS